MSFFTSVGTLLSGVGRLGEPTFLDYEDPGLIHQRQAARLLRSRILLDKARGAGPSDEAADAIFKWLEGIAGEELL